MEAVEIIVHSHPEGRNFVWSYEVSDQFQKRHADVLRAIDELISQLPDSEHKRIFALRTRQLPVGFPVNGVQPMRQDRCYAMTRDGFTLLAMGFTGKKALQFKLGYIKAFNALEESYRASQQQVSSVAATQEVARLAQYTSIPKQISCVKEVASTLMRHTRAPFAVINHHRQVMKALTGERPSEYVSQAVKAGHKVRGKSGRAVLRQLEPAKAATAAVLDDAIQQGKSLQEIERAGIVLALPRAFEAILQLGLNPADLQADRAA